MRERSTQQNIMVLWLVLRSFLRYQQTTFPIPAKIEQPADYNWKT
jgi:hypothetical protein